MNSFTCAQCGWKGYPSFNLHPKSNKLRAACSNPECNFIDDDLGPSDFSTGIAVTKDDAGKKQTTRVDLAGVDLNASTRHDFDERLERAREVPRPRLSITPQDVVGLARARLGELDLEIARLEGLKTERNQLRRMVQAAERTPKPREPRVENVVESLQLRLEN